MQKLRVSFCIFLSYSHSAVIRQRVLQIKYVIFEEYTQMHKIYGDVLDRKFVIRKFSRDTSVEMGQS